MSKSKLLGAILVSVLLISSIVLLVLWSFVPRQLTYEKGSGTECMYFQEDIHITCSEALRLGTDASGNLVYWTLESDEPVSLKSNIGDMKVVFEKNGDMTVKIKTDGYGLYIATFKKVP